MESRSAEHHGYIPYIQSRKEETEEKVRQPGHEVRRWIAECFRSWVNPFRKLNPRYEKTDLSFLGFLHPAMSMIASNKVVDILWIRSRDMYRVGGEGRAGGEMEGERSDVGGVWLGR